MQKNVSPVTAIIIILAVLAIAAFAWMKYSTGPGPIAQGSIDQAKRARPARSQPSQKTARNPERRPSAIRGRGRALMEQRANDAKNPGSGTKTAPSSN